ncbi:MAG: hypothetical protein V4754_13735 [Pseudomonadota bacterium]
MSRSLDRLYDLLPVVQRMRDAERDYPLRALLRVINEQVNLVEDDIAQLYENWFIETCQDWVVPYIGDLIGYRAVQAGGDSAAGSPALRNRDRVLIPRREVANTLALRRRKGSVAPLALLAGDVAGWPARTVEFYTLLGWQQHLNHLRLQRARSADLRQGGALDLIGTPFDASARSVDVRRIGSGRRAGRYNIASVGVFVWRLKVHSVTHAPAYCVESAGAECYTFNVLGHDTPLYTLAQTDPPPSHSAAEIDMPVPIRRRALEQRVSLRPLRTQAVASLYGEGKSLVIDAPGWPSKHAPQPVPREQVVPADLSDWAYRAPPGVVAVDPVRGRMVFPLGQAPKRGVWVSYHAAFSADMGGGEYARALSQPLLFALYPVSKDRPGAGVFETIGEALAQWRADQQALGGPPQDAAQLAAWRHARQRLRAAVIEIGDSSAYSERIDIELAAGENLQIRAANRSRPVIRLLDYLAQRADGFTVSGRRASRFTLDGVIVTGRGMRILGPERGDGDGRAGAPGKEGGAGGQEEGREGPDDLCDVTLRHVTLVPGWALECDCDPRRPNEASLELLYTSARVRIEHSIIGSIEVAADEVQSDPVELAISDSIVDATSDERSALGAPNLSLAFARLSICRSTVLGTVATHAIGLAENTLFAGLVTVGRRQHGCLRYCYVEPGSRTPRRHRCQPETAVQAAFDQARDAAAVANQAGPDPDALATLRWRATARVSPRFTSTRYGHPAYCQLACDCAAEIAHGADDEAEMGAFHDLFQPQREANLRARLEEYTPAGMDVGVLFAN